MYFKPRKLMIKTSNYDFGYHKKADSHLLKVERCL